MRIENNILIAECTAYDFKGELEKKKIRDWLKSISAFANSYGGSLFYGVDKKGRIVGIDDPQAAGEFISEKIKAHLDPVPRFRLIPYELEDGKHIMEVSVEAGNLTPYYVFLDGSRMAYVRMGDESVPADAHSLTELVLRGANKSWDALVSDVKRPDKTFVQLTETYLKQTEQPFEEKLLASFGLVTPDGFLTNAGLLFADECPVYQSRVVCTRWSGLHKDDAINDAEFQGNLLRLLKNSQDFIKANTAKRWYKLPTYRLNFPEYSERAITEVLINHLIHRQYTVIGGELHIDIYDDRIEFITPGGMVDGTLIQDFDIDSVSSLRRNPIIADVLTQMDYMEKRGSGLRKILTLTSKLHTYTPDKQPSFRSNQSTFHTIVPNVNYGITDEQFAQLVEQRRLADEEKYPVTAESSPVTAESSPVKTRPLGKTAQRIIDALIDDPTLTREALANKLDIKFETVKKQIASLRSRKVLDREGSDKNGYWVVLIRK